MRILALSGSLRAQSLNALLLHEAGLDAQGRLIDPVQVAQLQASLATLAAAGRQP